MKYILYAITDMCTYTYRGDWIMCPRNTYIGQFDVKIEEFNKIDSTTNDDTALNDVKMRCFHNEGTLAKYFISYHILDDLRRMLD